MSKVCFSAGHGLNSYAGRTAARVHDGDVVEVSADLAAYLCESFPKNFAQVKGGGPPAAAKAALDVPDHKAVIEPPKRRTRKPKKGDK